MCVLETSSVNCENKVQNKVQSCKQEELCNNIYSYESRTESGRLGLIATYIYSCRGFKSRTHAGSLRWGEKSVCRACFGVHSDLINLHPLSSSVEDGF